MTKQNHLQIRTAALAAGWSLIGLVIAALIVAAGSMVDKIPSWLNVTVGTSFFALWALTVAGVTLDGYADRLQELEMES